ncbi:DUF459 domain-containing protein [Kineococcus arenarius]|uniref:DUF459 domain-containing protein n=1 Tax=Kineococcus sp. SYSU DK021 TaxID=3383142 RepID=UPI003D7E11BC
MTGDVRVCFVGDSFVAGVGDEQHLGWAGRLAASTHARGQALTGYNLGVRRDTSTDVLARWFSECTPRLPTGVRGGVVVSFGVNDGTLRQDDAAGSTRVLTRVDPRVSVTNLLSLLEQARAARWQVLVVGPPPVDDEEHNRRTAALDTSFAAACSQQEVAYVSVLPALLGDDVWRREVREGDGAHPAAEGYQRLAALVLPVWDEWIGSLPGSSDR